MKEGDVVVDKEQVMEKMKAMQDDLQALMDTLK